MSSKQDSATLKLFKRTIVGRKVKRLAKDAYVPVVMYSKGNSANFKARYGDVQSLLNKATSTTIVDIDMEDGEPTQAVITAIDIHPVTDIVRHVSLYELDKDALIDFTVPFEFTGVSPAVKNGLGTLIHSATSLEVRCKPKDLPDVIVVDITGMEKVGDTILVEDIELPAGVSLIRDEQVKLPIATITQLRKETEAVSADTDEEGEEGVAADAGATDAEQSSDGDAE